MNAKWKSSSDYGVQIRPLLLACATKCSYETTSPPGKDGPGTLARGDITRAELWYPAQNSPARAYPLHLCGPFSFVFRLRTPDSSCSSVAAQRRAFVCSLPHFLYPPSQFLSPVSHVWWCLILSLSPASALMLQFPHSMGALLQVTPCRSTPPFTG